jgi:hypothetical protein
MVWPMSWDGVAIGGNLRSNVLQGQQRSNLGACGTFGTDRLTKAGLLLFRDASILDGNNEIRESLRDRVRCPNQPRRQSPVRGDKVEQRLRETAQAAHLVWRHRESNPASFNRFLAVECNRKRPEPWPPYCSWVGRLSTYASSSQKLCLAIANTVAQQSAAGKHRRTVGSSKYVEPMSRRN